MPIDVERLFKRVVDQVFSDAAAVEYAPHPKYSHDWRASVISSGVCSREIEIRATYEWFSAHIPAHGVGTIVFEHDDDEAEKEAALRELALVMLAYLQGSGSVGIRRGLFGVRKRPFVTIDSDGKRWVLGRHTSSIEELRSTD